MYCIYSLFTPPSQATAVMDSFKSSFVEALNSSPSAMCDSCPLKQLHLLCQSLEGQETRSKTSSRDLLLGDNQPH